MSMYKSLLFATLEAFPDDQVLVCDEWSTNPQVNNPPKPTTVGELRALYANMNDNERLIIVDKVAWDDCKKADFELVDGKLIMELY